MCYNNVSEGGDVMNRKKIQVSLNPGLIKEIDRITEKNGYTRSRVIEEILERGIIQAAKTLNKRGLDR